MRRLQRLIALERRIAEQRLEQLQAHGGAGGEADGDGAVELDHGRRVQLHQRPVELGDLRPVGRLGVRGLDLQGGDRRLQLVLARPPQAHRALQLREPVGDPVPIPERSVLGVERDPPPARVHARGTACVVQQHQRRQPPDLGVLGPERGQQLAEPDRLVAELAADEPVALGGRVALVEDQVHDPQDAPQPVGQLLVGRDPVRDVRVGDLALRAHDPLAHRRLGDEEGASDLAGRQAAERPQRERHARRHVERRVAAGEDQPQPVVDDRALVVHGRLLMAGLLQPCQLGQALGAVGDGPVPAQAIDRAPPGGGGDPCPRVGRDAVAPPHGDRPLEGVLDRVLGELEVADLADERGQHHRPLVAKRARDRGRDGVARLRGAGHVRSLTSSSVTSTPASRARRAHSSAGTTGRTSTVPQRVMGSRAAWRSASSRSAHSRM